MDTCKPDTIAANSTAFSLSSSRIAQSESQHPASSHRRSQKWHDLPFMRQSISLLAAISRGSASKLRKPAVSLDHVSNQHLSWESERMHVELSSKSPIKTSWNKVEFIWQFAVLTMYSSSKDSASYHSGGKSCVPWIVRDISFLCIYLNCNIKGRKKSRNRYQN